MGNKKMDTLSASIFLYLPVETGMKWIRTFLLAG